MAGRNRETGSEQAEFSYHEYYFVLLRDFVDEAKISLVSAYPVCVGFTACSFPGSPPPSLLRTQSVIWDGAVAVARTVTPLKEVNKKGACHNSSPRTTNLPVQKHFCCPPVGLMISRPFGGNSICKTARGSKGRCYAPRLADEPPVRWYPWLSPTATWALMHRHPW